MMNRVVLFVAISVTTLIIALGVIAKLNYSCPISERDLPQPASGEKGSQEPLNQATASSEKEVVAVNAISGEGEENMEHRKHVGQQRSIEVRSNDKRQYDPQHDHTSASTRGDSVSNDGVSNETSFGSKRERFNRKPGIVTVPPSIVSSNDEVDGFLEKDATKHGAAQVGLMFRDRPAMARFPDGRLLSEEDEIYKWAVKRFSEGLDKIHIYWNAHPPSYDSIMAECVHPTESNGYKGLIRVRESYNVGVREGEHRSFEELWNSAVYALIDIDKYHDYDELLKLAFQGKLSRGDWIRKNTEIAYETNIQMATFYKELWQPWATDRGMDTNPTLWGLDLPSTYEQWIDKLKDVSEYPESYWGSYYDSEIAPRQ